MKRLDSSEQIGVVNTLMNDLAQQFASETSTTTQLEEQAAQKAAHLMDAVDVVMDSEMKKVHALNPDVAAAETEQMKVMQQIVQDSEEQHVDILSILGDVSALAAELQGAMKTRGEQVEAGVTALEKHMESQ